jgi:hypothetical protein
MSRTCWRTLEIIHFGLSLTQGRPATLVTHFFVALSRVALKFSTA